MVSNLLLYMSFYWNWSQQKFVNLIRQHFNSKQITCVLHLFSSWAPCFRSVFTTVRKRWTLWTCWRALRNPFVGTEHWFLNCGFLLIPKELIVVLKNNGWNDTIWISLLEQQRVFQVFTDRTKQFRATSFRRNSFFEPTRSNFFWRTRSYVVRRPIFRTGQRCRNGLGRKNVRIFQSDRSWERWEGGEAEEETASKKVEENVTVFVDNWNGRLWLVDEFHRLVRWLAPAVGKPEQLRQPENILFRWTVSFDDDDAVRWWRHQWRRRRLESSTTHDGHQIRSDRAKRTFADLAANVEKRKFRFWRQKLWRRRRGDVDRGKPGQLQPEKIPETPEKVARFSGIPAKKKPESGEKPAPKKPDFQTRSRRVWLGP